MLHRKIELARQLLNAQYLHENEEGQGVYIGGGALLLILIVVLLVLVL